MAKSKRKKNKLARQEHNSWVRAQNRINNERKQRSQKQSTKPKDVEKQDKFLTKLVKLSIKYYHTADVEKLDSYQIEKLITWATNHSMERGKVQRARGYAGKKNQQKKNFIA